MSPRTIASTLVAVAILLPAVIAHARHDAVTSRHAPAGPAYARAPADPSAGTFSFAPSVSALNRQAFLTAATHVRPEAARLFDRIDGLVTVEDGEPGDGALGVTVSTRTGYTIRFHFGAVFRLLGQRGFDRLIEHELGHVVDFALLTPAVRTQLDEGIPPGLPCQAGTRIGSCAPRAERFAESFAKWASGDLGTNVYAGYAVPPPPDLDSWGAPLAALAR